ncbi:MAG: hypothetical protein V1861_01530 [Candidatus Micrarchaeota archaeon]
MERIAFVLGFALIVVLFAGCIQPQMSDKVPKDLEITYSYGACHAEWGRTNIQIDATGNGIYESGSGSYDNGRFQNEEFRKQFRMNETELLGLLNGIEESGFFSLSDSYSDLNIIDGSCEYISVTKNGTTKGVSVSNTAGPGAYEKAAELIGAYAQDKIS